MTPSRPFLAALLLLGAMLLPETASAQLERRLADSDRPVDDIFKAPKIIGLNSVKQIGKNHLHMSILHTFAGPVSGGFDTFFGIDGGANVRLGLDYGISDRVSVGLGRTSLFKVVDTRLKWTPVVQRTESTPVSVGLLGSVSIETLPNLRPNPELSDKLAYLGMAMVARKFNERLSLQLSPMVAHFQRPIADGLEDTFYALGIGGRFKVGDRTAITFEAVPMLDRPAYLELPMALGIDMETGGHVFQIFFTTSQFHTEHYIVANNVDPFFDKKALFRIGFNVNRIFAL